MKTIKEKLIKSPLFNLSLTNKELFHSNFIAWFGKLYPELFIQLISDLLGENKWADGVDAKKMDIRREYNNFDISVFDSEDSKPVSDYNKIGFSYELTEIEESIINSLEIDFIVDNIGNLEEKYDKPKGKKVLVPFVCTDCGKTEWKTIDNEKET